MSFESEELFTLEVTSNKKLLQDAVIQSFKCNRTED